MGKFRLRRTVPDILRTRISDGILSGNVTMTGTINANARHDRRLFHRSGTHWIYGHGKWLRWRTGHLQRFVPRGKHHFLRSVGSQHFSRLLGRDLCGGAHRQQQGKFIYEQLRVVYRCEERSPKLWGGPMPHWSHQPPSVSK